MSKAIIVSCFDWYKGRLEYVENLLKNKGYSVQIWLSDFSHMKKCQVEKLENLNYIHVRPYQKNLSFERLYSHYGFSKDIIELLSDEQPDIVYALIPPNSVAWTCGKYKKAHPNSKLIFDIIDMWPESYTASRYLQTPFKLWASLRDSNLRYADHIFTECAFYQNFLDKNLAPKMSALHLCREKSYFAPIPKWDNIVVEIGYLGSINNIIDIPKIESLIKEFTKYKKVIVHIVGGGESKEILIHALNRSGADVHDHGVIFDKDKMRSIIGQCHFAINMMKPSVCVGLTIKSMDYFQMGVPILNTIKGDTKEIVENYHCGWNIDNINICGEHMKLLNEDEYEQMRINTQKVFTDMFTVQAFQDNLKSVIRSII